VRSQRGLSNRSLLAAMVAAWLPFVAAAQERDAGAARRQFPAGTLGRLVPARIDSLRRLLAGPENTWGAVRRFYFGDTYLATLPDLIVYIDTKDSVRQALIQHGQLVHPAVLRGEKFIYVLVFAENPLVVVAPDSVKVPTLRIRRTSLDYRTDPFLVAVLKGFGSKLFGGAPEPRSAAVADSSVEVPLARVGVGSDATRPALHVMMARLPLADDTWNRVHVAGARGREIPGGKSVVTNFGNAGRSRFGMSLGLGATYDARTMALKDTALGPSGEHIRVSLYLYSHLYLARPSLPWSGKSVALMAGTNLARGEALNDLVAGLSFGRLIGDLGVVVGVNALSSKRGDGSDTREIRPFVGLDFHL